MLECFPDIVDCLVDGARDDASDAYTVLGNPNR